MWAIISILYGKYARTPCGNPQLQARRIDIDGGTRQPMAPRVKFSGGLQAVNGPNDWQDRSRMTRPRPALLETADE